AGAGGGGGAPSGARVARPDAARAPFPAQRAGPAPVWRRMRPPDRGAAGDPPHRAGLPVPQEEVRTHASVAGSVGPDHEDALAVRHEDRRVVLPAVAGVQGSDRPLGPGTAFDRRYVLGIPLEGALLGAALRLGEGVRLGTDDHDPAFAAR